MSSFDLKKTQFELVVLGKLRQPDSDTAAVLWALHSMGLKMRFAIFPIHSYDTLEM
jgi:hypothetical protein